MRTFLLGGVAALALLPAPLLAQEAPATIPDQVEAFPEGASTIDTVIPSEDAPVATVARTGDPVLDRLNALEAKLQALESRNRQLEEAAAATQTRVEKVEVRAARSVQPGPAPTFADVGGNFTFKPRGTFQIDYAGYNRRGAGTYDYNSGTDIRRGRLGFDGTLFKHFKYRIEAEIVKGATNLLDAYVSYGGIKNWVFTVGQQKAPYGLEANTTDALNSFLERGMANVAFGAVGAERRVGVTAAYQTDKLNATIGLFGSGEAVQRNESTPDEGYGVNARVTWDPILDTGKIVHVGASAFKAAGFPAHTISSLGDRPGSRVDGGRLVSVNINGTAPNGGAPTGARSATYWGLESAAVFGPFSVQGEYSKLKIDRYGAASNFNADGYYVFASWFITGESRSFKNGSADRTKPFSDFTPGGGWGAFELLARYDVLDLTDADFQSIAGSAVKRKGETWTAGLNWYLNPNVKFVANYIRFKGQNSPLVFPAIPAAALNGPNSTAKGDIFGTRLQVDF
ncbi:OprO/OprP family phosphate-selective porin [Sphingomonas sp. SRS2]|uniref:OprO/OprP family phosphate-selective porin n=1 Tax=Sphingomonas sp. SRS2 TaxID=133190 RepID=UPI0006184F22|nr:porin [Sphingomonas sp. SRS2]KKC27077.1 porin [Sphingomonas sp. SRS2]